MICIFEDNIDVYYTEEHTNHFVHHSGDETKAFLL